MLDSLRCIKLSYENSAANSSRNRRDLAEGEKAYGEATDAYNYLIRQLRDALMALDSSGGRNSLNYAIDDANAKAQEFCNWCYGKTQDASRESCGSCGSAESFMPDPISVGLQLQQIQEAREQVIRTYVLEELEKCQWATWKEVRSR